MLPGLLTICAANVNYDAAPICLILWANGAVENGPGRSGTVGNVAQICEQ